MNQSRLEIKVGLFVLVCLVLLALLLIQFSRGVSFFHSTYSVILNAGNVGDLRAQSSVLESGVKVGSVARIELSPGGTNVAIYLKILNTYPIHDDAVFSIEKSGFLGDEYVAIYPTKNAGALLTNGSLAHTEEPFNLQKVAASATGIITRLDDTLLKINTSIDAIRQTALNDTALTNISDAIRNLHQVSEDARVTVANINSLIQTNGATASSAMSNLLAFSGQLEGIAGHAEGILSANEPRFNDAVSNLQSATVQVNSLLAGVDSGKGVAGKLLKDQAMADDLAALARNLSVTTSNLNQFGLWHVLFHKEPLPSKQPTYR